MGMDLGRCVSVGLCAIPLWTLGFVGRILGLGSWSLLGTAVVCASFSRLVWRSWLGHRLWLGLGLWDRVRWRIRLVPAGIS
jgi:hypothetical protein